MKQLTAPVLSEAAATLCIFCLLLVPLGCTGMALINTGLIRSRSAAHSMTAALCVIGVAAAAFFCWGFAWQGVAGGGSYQAVVAGTVWNWIGAEHYFLRGIAYDGSATGLTAALEMMSVALAALIPLGCNGGRWRLGACCASTALFAGVTYPLFGHWAWGGGWLAALGVNFGLGRGFVDSGGSGVIQTVGGLTALALAWIIGPRRDKFGMDGRPAAIPGHNSLVVIFGCLLAWMGWLGLNGAGAMLFSGAESGRVALVAINTTLAAGAGALAAALVTRVRFGKPDASLTANGWVTGLVASSAGCLFFDPPEAVIAGLVAGALVVFAVELFELRLGIDDPAGAISVHASGGLWGVLAVGLFADFPGRPVNGVGAGPGDANQWLAQLVGIATLIGCILPLTYGLNWVLNRFHRQRVNAEGERQGLDLYELGAGAYPEFVHHGDEFAGR